MKYESIADIYSANAKARDGLSAALDGVTPEQAATIPGGERWSVQHVAEHVSMVEGGIAMICSRMIEAAKAEGKPADGAFALSEKFRGHLANLATARLEAPDRVQPSGDVTIDASREKLAHSTATIDRLRSDLEAIDVSGHTFPHPYFGPLTATEWLVVAGLHERRHTAQIASLLAKMKQ